MDAIANAISSRTSTTDNNSPSAPPSKKSKFEEAPRAPPPRHHHGHHRHHHHPRRQSSRTQEKHRIVAFQYLPDVRTTRFKLEGVFQYCCDIFPEEIVREILLRLPSVKSLIKCSVVCKSWRNLIQSPSFIADHLHRNQNQIGHDDDGVVGSLYLIRWSINRYTLYWDKPASASASSFNINDTNSKIITPSTYQQIDTKVTPSSYGYYLVGTCNGLVCLADEDYFCPSFPIIIWNPSVRKFVTLPHPTITIPEKSINDKRDPITPAYAFGYDSRTNDYKVLTIFSSNPSSGPDMDNPFAVQVYSLARGSWKTLSPPPPAPPSLSIPGCNFVCRRYQPANARPVFVNGAVHWLLWPDDVFIVSFDMATESFSKIELPKTLRESACLPYVTVYEDSLAMINTWGDYSGCYYELYVMQEYGVVESWSDSYRVTLPKPFPSSYHVGFKSNGEQVFIALNNDVEVVDFKTKQIKYSGVGEGVGLKSIDSFVETLVLLDQSNTDSYGF
ncbi:F-box protein CPR1-like [Malus sylvestris]|uniref:F-box protein CPR1-like n=1 Tax=Malus sylvestris TaxID=3752 RepID=UPI0021ABA576|nr:F-box protein CPR1-like [Malus sylvestris]